MKTKAISSKWVYRTGKRLDARPYLSGALEARMIIESGNLKRVPLSSVVHGHNGGIFNGPMFSRTYVSAEHGVPFVGSSDMLMADLSGLAYLARKEACSPRLAFLRLHPGMTLISCSGTIGRMVYVRPDMDGIWSSQHIMKVVPDPDRIPSGYLFAFLSSRFGVPLITSGTYGAIIQHIEPEHLKDLPVPRLGDTVEQKVHRLVEEASVSRSKAVDLLKESHARFASLLDIQQSASKSDNSLWTSVRSSKLVERCDAYYFSNPCLQARQAFDRAHNCESRPLHTVAAAWIPGIFKRLYASDPQYGCPYITGADVFQLAPTTNQFLMRRVAEEYRLLIKTGMILIQEAGQLGGLIGRSVLVGRYLDHFAVTNNMVRVTPHEPTDTGYIYAVLSSPPGITLIAREAAGSSIPHLDAGRVRNIDIPWAAPRVRHEIGELANEAVRLRDHACDLDTKARTLVEQAIEENS